MAPVLLILLMLAAAIATTAINVYGWRVIPDETHIAFRWFVFGTRETTRKKVGLVLWSLPEYLILGALAFIDDPVMRWVGFGLLSYLLVMHFFAIRRLSLPSRLRGASAL